MLIGLQFVVTYLDIFKMVSLTFVISRVAWPPSHTSIITYGEILLITRCWAIKKMLILVEYIHIHKFSFVKTSILREMLCSKMDQKADRNKRQLTSWMWSTGIFTENNFLSSSNVAVTSLQLFWAHRSYRVGWRFWETERLGMELWLREKSVESFRFLNREFYIVVMFQDKRTQMQ